MNKNYLRNRVERKRFDWRFSLISFRYSHMFYFLFTYLLMRVYEYENVDLICGDFLYNKFLYLRFSLPGLLFFFFFCWCTFLAWKMQFVEFILHENPVILLLCEFIRHVIVMVENWILIWLTHSILSWQILNSNFVY